MELSSLTRADGKSGYKLTSLFAKRSNVNYLIRSSEYLDYDEGINSPDLFVSVCSLKCCKC